MKNFYTHILSTLIFFVLFQASVIGQQLQIENSELYREEIELLSDRTVYSVGEQIHFKAFYASGNSIADLDFSKVLYVELIKPDGSPLIQEKFPLDKSGSHGTLDIPAKLLTGNYYLRAYTKWMRNFNVASYAYNQIQIFNASNKNLYTYNEEEKSGTIDCKFTDIAPNKDLALQTDKQSYNRREKVTVNLKLNQKYFGKNNYCVSVVKKGAKQDKIIQPKNIFQQESDTGKVIKYFPEIYGLSLSGNIKAFENNKDFYQVNIGSLNGLAYFSSFNTKHNGYFNFNLPLDIGLHELFISVNSEGQSVKIEIDNAFCEKPVFMKQADVSFNESQKKVASQIAINKQITDAFQNNSDNNDIKGQDYNMNFYGTGNKMLYIKDYIELPYVEDFLFELVPEVIVKHHKGIPSIFFARKQTLSNYPMLLMVDNIIIYDMQAFLKISPQKLRSIEVIDHGYIVGENKFSGILSAVSNNSDMAGIDLPKNAMFLKFKLYNQSILQDKMIAQSPINNGRIPDRRNCLYWNPNFDLISGKENSFSFYTSDVPGDYQVYIQTFNAEGEIVTSVAEFRVE